MTTPRIFAIDLGYGNTKFTTHIGSTTRDIRCDLFPSICPALGPNAAIGDFAKLNCGPVTVEGVTYLVGPDALTQAPVNYVRALNTEFPRTPQYLALYRGALARAGMKEIDLVIGGLPIERFKAMREETARVLSGVHPLDDGTSVLVKDVLIVPQAMGAQYWQEALRLIEGGKPLKGRRLLIDPGFFTLDWVVADAGTAVQERSGSFQGGVSAYLSHIADRLSEQFGVPFRDLDRIDRSLRTNEPYEVYGKPVDMAPHVASARAIFRNGVQAILSKVGTLTDISEVIIVGGGGHLLSSLIESDLNGIPMTVVPDPVFANVKGFALLGKSRFMNRAALERAA